MQKYRTKRAEIEKKIREAKAEYKFEHPAVCESCGKSGTFLGISHIISVNDCLNSAQIPEELAYDDRNMTLECHGGGAFGSVLSCHLITETKKETSYHLKLKQNNLNKKLRLYKQYRRYLYDDLVKLRDESQ